LVSNAVALLHAGRNASVNAKFRKALTEIVDEAGARGGLPKSKGNLLYYTAGKVGGPAPQSLDGLPAI
jgi:hypothetical protein